MTIKQQIKSISLLLMKFKTMKFADAGRRSAALSCGQALNSLILIDEINDHIGNPGIDRLK